MRNEPQLVLVWPITEGVLMTRSPLNPSRQLVVVCLLSLFVTAAASAATPIAPVNTEHGLAVKGYDPVSYFVGSEEARSTALALASVRRSNWACSFPAPSFHEDAVRRVASEGIIATKFTSPYSP